MDKTIKLDRNAIVNELIAMGVKMHGNSCRCPFHDDHTPSSYIKENENGWYFACKVCNISGDVFDLQQRRTGKSFKELVSESEAYQITPKEVRYIKPFNSPEEIILYYAQSKNLTLQRKYEYRDPKTEKLDLVILRLLPPNGKKTFRQLTPVEGGWVTTGVKGKSPLYNRARILGSDEVVVVEGEKCVHALYEIGIVATTSPMGARSAMQSDWSILQGKKIHIWPDNDEEGIDYANDVKKILASLPQPTEAKIIDISPLELKPKEDVFDYLKILSDRGHTLEEQHDIIKKLISNSVELNNYDLILERLQNIRDGKEDLLVTAIPYFESKYKTTRPSTITLMGGVGGSAKSFFSLFFAGKLHKLGVKCAYIALEEDKGYWLQRLLAIMSKKPGLLNVDWVKQNHELAIEIAQSHEEFLKTFQLILLKSVNYDQCLDTIERLAKEGVEHIIVDPISAIEKGNLSWEDDKRFLNRAKTIAEIYRCRFMFMTHPKSGNFEKPSLAGFNGSMAFPNFCQTALWLVDHGEGKECNVMMQGQVDNGYINKEIIIFKARDKTVSHKRYGLIFNVNTLQWEEKGFIVD